jgi:hypothetical protein
MSGVEAPSWQGEETQEYLVYSEFSQRSQVGCIGAKNVKLFLREPSDDPAIYQNKKAPVKSSFTEALVSYCMLHSTLAYESLYPSAVIALLLLCPPLPYAGKESHMCLLDNAMGKVKPIIS